MSMICQTSYQVCNCTDLLCVRIVLVRYCRLQLYQLHCVHFTKYLLRLYLVLFIVLIRHFIALESVVCRVLALNNWWWTLCCLQTSKHGESSWIGVHCWTCRIRRKTCRGAHQSARAGQETGDYRTPTILIPLCALYVFVRLLVCLIKSTVSSSTMSCSSCCEIYCRNLHYFITFWYLFFRLSKRTYFNEN